MSIQASFAVLKTLLVLDRRIAALSKELDSEKVGISDKAERHVALSSRISKIEAVVSTMESTKNELNQELRQHHQQLEKAREKMNRCRNEREANAAQRELEEIRRLSREREAEINKITGLISDARADVEALEAERSELTGEIDETEGAAATRVREMATDLEEQQAKRSTTLEQLPKTLVRRYEAVQSRRGTGTAAVLDGSCMACHISLSPMMWQELQRMQEFFQCPNCHRVLYIGDESDRHGDSLAPGAEGEADGEGDEGTASAGEA